MNSKGLNLLFKKALCQLIVENEIIVSFSLIYLNKLILFLNYISTNFCS